MRFVLGPPPDDPDFAPEPGGWKRVRVPSSWMLVLFGSLIGILLCVATGMAWSLVPVKTEIPQLNLSGLGLKLPVIAVPFVILLQFILFLAVLVVVHELLHAFAFPGFGRNKILGLWPQRLMPYADYHDALPCWRFIVVAFAPLACLSVVPLAIGLIVGSAANLWMFVSVVNALASGGDVLLAAAVASQVPLGALVRNKAWDTWWHPG